MAPFRARYRGTPSSVRLARAAVVDYARAAGFGTESIAEIALAAGEALANAVEHGSKDLGFIEVVCEFRNDTLSIEISDAGLGFDVSTVKPHHRDPNAVRGFGISIMHAIMDEVAYFRRGAAVRLKKRRTAALDAPIDAQQA